MAHKGWQWDGYQTGMPEDSLSREVAQKPASRMEETDPPREKQGSERVLPRVVHIIRSQTFSETLGEREKSRIGLYARLVSRLSLWYSFFTRANLRLALNRSESDVATPRRALWMEKKETPSGPAARDGEVVERIIWGTDSGEFKDGMRGQGNIKSRHNLSGREGEGARKRERVRAGERGVTFY